jgi:outer membrane protein OmpA-like peptidoglycan-associated protein
MLGFLFLQPTKAQQVNTLYFLDNVPIRHSFNPAIQPLSGFYLSLPVVGNTQLHVGNNSLTVSSLALPKFDLLNTIKPTTLLNVDADINLLGFGFRTKSSYWNFSSTLKSSVRIGIPKDMIEMGLIGNVRFNPDGTPILVNNLFDFTSLSVNANSYIEAALGYSKQLNEKWYVGLKLKYLYGLGAANLGFDSFKYTSGIDKWTLNTEAKLDYAYPDIQTGGLTSLMKPTGTGIGVDLGIEFKPTENLRIGAAVTDLGSINWKTNPSNNTLGVHYTLSRITGFTIDELIDGINSNTISDNLLVDFLDSVRIDPATNNSFKTSLSPKVNISGEYGFLNNALSIGLLSSTMIYNKNLYSNLTTSFNVKPVNWFNLSLSYSLLNGRGSNLGAGLGFRLGMINLFATADYIPFNYAPLKTPYSVDLSSIPVVGTALGTKTISRVPAKTERLNVAIGFNIVFGNKIDADNDGISNRRDKCPDTPHGVIVDKKGCPLDTDGDKVPDYYDKCPDTPKEAYSTIDADGCPLDTDGDGVFDYLDKCPDTPYQAYKTVDKNGCPKDTDMDGVPDYLDKCPKTPADERSMVDTTGCTIKVVAPVVEQPKVEEVPVVAPVVVSTPVVDKDTDGDGIVDRLDRCPQLAGVASNGGCPEIKKEVRVVFQKAIQGIQFETAKYIIKPLSFVILDHVAKVLAENPNYRVEVQGHTDTEGKPETNLTLSNNRANAVRDYLITKGIDANRLTANGYGQNRPVAPNTTIEGKAKNRRVEFVVSFE